MEKLLSIHNLKKYFPLKKSNIFQRERMFVRANEDISIDIYKGETFGLVGESGCGKSTLGLVILQLYSQTAGNVMYYGRTLEQVAPAYVLDTLRHAGKYIAEYKKAKAHADEIAEKCDRLGEHATFFDLQQKNLAQADARTKLDKVSKILGGFMVKDTERGAELLYHRYECAVDAAEKEELIRDCDIEIEALKGMMEGEEKGAKGEKARALAEKLNKLKTRSAQLAGELEELRKKTAEALEKVEQERARYAGDEEFARYEAMLDDGVDLSRLSINEMRLLRKDLQIIFQDPYSSLDPRMTVGQIIKEGLVTHKFFKRGSEKMKEYVLNMMRSCGLQNYMYNRYPHQFSGGQRQRICITRSLAVQPKFVVCDECVSALDVSIQSQIINLLQELKEKQKLTYLFISHNLSVVRYISDRIGVMYLGNMVEVAATDVLFEDPRHPYTIALLSAIPTTDPESLTKERILLEGSIPSPIRPPSGCKFHTRCFMATEKCSQVAPPLTEIAPGHFVACHYPERKIDESGNYLFHTETTHVEARRSRGQGNVLR